YLPWTSLGHYPGSLGRYMWFERKIPVLTMELKEDLPKTLRPFEELQDIIGVLVGLDHGPRNPAETSIAH
ncbi:MAG: murein peptide amidase A, partial [Proteobacteria bacterium]|nr:murein peptide amidase A [Pseudomonadota bacterium]